MNKNNLFSKSLCLTLEKAWVEMTFMAETDHDEETLGEVPWFW